MVSFHVVFVCVVGILAHRSIFFGLGHFETSNKTATSLKHSPHLFMNITRALVDTFTDNVPC